MYILIDNYDSFTYIVKHYFEQNKAKVKVFRNDSISENKIISMNPEGIIISPGPKTPLLAGISINLINLASKMIPVLGICLGHQSIAQAYGALITRAKKVMHGKVSVIKHDESQLFNNIPKTFKATRYHSLIIDEKTIPNNLKINARSDDNTIMSISNPIGKAFGVQFHPESIETEFGINLIKNFIDMCKKNESNY